MPTKIASIPLSVDESASALLLRQEAVHRLQEARSKLLQSSGLDPVLQQHVNDSLDRIAKHILATRPDARNLASTMHVIARDYQLALPGENDHAWLQTLLSIDTMLQPFRRSLRDAHSAS